MVENDEDINNENDIDESEDLVRSFTIKVDPGQEPLRIDLFIQNRVEGVSRNKIQNAAKAGCVLIGEKAVKSNYKVKPNDEIKLILPKRQVDYKLEPEDIPLDIVYEDDDLIVLNKQAGLVVHPGLGNWTGTLVNALLYHVQNLPIKDNLERPGLVHRLDKDTSGLMVVAKNEFSMTHLAKQFFDRTTQRRYIALVWGDFDEDDGRIEGNIGRDPRYRKRMYVFEDGDFGKTAITNYKVLERFGYTTLVECKLETGRTHQIRVHMKYLKHPLFNDSTYGGNTIVKGTVYTKYKQFVDNCFKIMPRQALHAKSLGFTHPKTGEFMHFESELAHDMQELIEKWRHYAKHRM